LLVAFAQSLLAQSAIETALQATVTIEVIGPDGLSHGSGFIVSSDGMIITAAHVIDGATSALARLQNGEELNVEGVIAIDRARDFAILRVAGFDLPTVPLGNADDLSVGQRVIVIGAPIDAAYAGTISDGLLAADRLIDGTRTLQISAPTSPGNSGGPVLTEQGQVIGLVVSGITGAGAENLNFALPINYVRGQLSLAVTRPLQALAEVPLTSGARVTASAGATVACSISAEEFESLNSRVEQGDAAAQNQLGLFYYRGDCVPKDDAEVVRWYRLAAEQGLVAAQFNLGVMYYNGEGVPQDYVETVRLYRLAAEQGIAIAQNSLGNVYAVGQGVPEDDVEAVRWYRLAADQEYAFAQFNLGNMYDRGDGVPEDDVEAVRWYRLAAEQGYAVAQNNLGLMYYNGEGVREDNVLAYLWFNLAAAQGNENAQGNKDFVEQRMTRAQIAEAQRMSREWIAAHPPGGN
jgi:hypothetical protein